VRLRALPPLFSVSIDSLDDHEQHKRHNHKIQNLGKENTILYSAENGEITLNEKGQQHRALASTPAE